MTLEPKQRHLTLRIAGMNCGSCEIVLERALRSVPGILSATIDYRTGIARISVDARAGVSRQKLAGIIRQKGYGIHGSVPRAQNAACDRGLRPGESARRKWMEIGGAFIAVFALYTILQAFDLVSLTPAAAGSVTLGAAFLMGLIAGTSSCLAVTGGLLLSVAAKYHEIHPSDSRWEKFQPLLHFNFGRLASYFVLGGMIGLLGHAITLSTRVTGYLNIIVALVMLCLALSVLNIIPKGSFPLRPPKKLSHWIAGLAENRHPAAPLLLGGLTFFLPCGFTQSLQLVALGSGSFAAGAMVMFMFALGTLPALLSISVVSSVARGTASRLFLRFSGALVLVLALWNLQSGLLLSGVDAAGVLQGLGTSAPAAATAPGGDPNVTVDKNGKQIVFLRVTPSGYQPAAFTIQPGVETWIYARGEGARGCTTVLTDPTHNLTTQVKDGDNWLGPIPHPTDDFEIMCSMGMARASIHVARAATL